MSASRTVRIAGAMLLLNAVLVAIEHAITPGTSPDGGLPTGGMLPVIIDAAIGGSLLTGNLKYRGIAILRVVLGMLLFGGMAIAGGDVATAVAQVILSSSLLAMLVGEPGKLRQGLSFAGFGLLMVLQIFALYALATGRDPAAIIASAFRKDLDPVVGREVSGNAFRYHLTVPSDGWFLRKDAAAKAENPLADRWLTRPAEDVHVLVLAEAIAEKLPIEALTDAVVSNAKESSTDFKLVSRAPAKDGAGRVVHYTGTIKGIELEWLVGVFTDDKQVVQVITFGTQRGFPSMAGELQAVIDSFQFQ